MKFKVSSLLKSPQILFLRQSLSVGSRPVRQLFLSKIFPFIAKKTELVVYRITREEGSSEWSALKPSNRWNRYIIWTLVSVAGFGTCWAMFAQIDESITAPGKLEPIGSTLDIKPPIGGVIKNILVSEGDFVIEDQILLELDTTAAKARLDALLNVRDKTFVDLMLSKSQLGIPIDESKLNSNQLLRLASLKNEFKSRILASENSVLQAEAQLTSTQKQYDSQYKALHIRENILSDIYPLVEIGAMAKSQYLKELHEVELLRGNVKSLRSQLDQGQARVIEARSRLDNTKSLSLIDFSTKVEETEKQIAQLNNQISETKLTLEYQAIRSPKDGNVFDLKPSTPGYVVNGTDPVLKIVSTDRLVARVFVTNRDIGFLKVGQPARVRVDAFPYNEFGDLKGEIKSIGSDVLEPDSSFDYYRFPVTINLLDSKLAYKGTSLPLVPGMSVSTNITLRQRPVISLFTQRILPFWDRLVKL